MPSRWSGAFSPHSTDVMRSHSRLGPSSHLSKPGLIVKMTGRSGIEGLSLDPRNQFNGSWGLSLLLFSAAFFCVILFPSSAMASMMYLPGIGFWPQTNHTTLETTNSCRANTLAPPWTSGKSYDFGDWETQALSTIEAIAASNGIDLCISKTYLPKRIWSIAIFLSSVAGPNQTMVFRHFPVDVHHLLHFEGFLTAVFLIYSENVNPKRS
jgi:hypothetical protein